MRSIILLLVAAAFAQTTLPFETPIAQGDATITLMHPQASLVSVRVVTRSKADLAQVEVSYEYLHPSLAHVSPTAKATLTVKGTAPLSAGTGATEPMRVPDGAVIQSVRVRFSRTLKTVEFR